MKVLAVDCGNTRLKWGLHENDAWTDVGVLAHDALGELGGALAKLPRPDRVAVANVAGAGARAALEPALAVLNCPVQWLSSTARQCGITNRYAAPDRLGVDRWCAVIGARHFAPGACVVVGAGTATTVDLLSAGNEFLGGLILPGVLLMKRALAENTAGLPLAAGAYAMEPRSTVDAIESGVLHAQAGAIERMAAHLAGSGRQGVTCLVSGGAAGQLAPALNIPFRIVDHLVLEGVVRIALAGAG